MTDTIAVGTVPVPTARVGRGHLRVFLGATPGSREPLPDQVLDNADEIQFIDISPEALRKRMRHGNVYARDKIDTALANFFRPGNLAAMRQIGLRLVADSMARSRTVVDSPEDVLVAVSGGAASEELMRRGARLARRR